MRNIGVTLSIDVQLVELQTWRNSYEPLPGTTWLKIFNETVSGERGKGGA